jgi:hypothetical protein
MCVAAAFTLLEFPVLAASLASGLATVGPAGLLPCVWALHDAAFPAFATFQAYVIGGCGVYANDVYRNCAGTK